MKLGTQVGLFNDYGNEKYKKMKELGFDYADIGIEGELNGKTEEEYAASILREKALADEAGVTVWQVHGPWRWPPHDETEALRTERAEVMRRSIDLTARIGCKYWVIHPLMPFGDYDTYPDFNVEEFYRINYEFFRALLPYAKERGVVICFENMPMKGMRISPPSRTLEFIREINDESFKLCLDTGHAIVLGESPADAVRMAGDDLKVLHIHDNSGNRDEHLLPLMGVIDWADFKKALTETGFDGVFSYETSFRSFLPHATTETKLKCLLAITKEIIPE